ncbi:MAG: RNA-binding protein S4 [Geminicoccus sp.]|nr:RNA-binding protein S4 [Geminicoccus sp.]
MTEGQAAKLRIDKWLWYARFFKTRTLAADVANGGKIRVNKVSIRKASAEVKVGDVLTFHQGPNIRVVEVAALGTSRRPYEEARLLYSDLAPLPERGMREEAGENTGQQTAGQPIDARTIPVAEREFGAGRPTKRERRDTDRLRDL